MYKKYKYPPTQISYTEDVLKEVFRRHRLTEKYNFKQCLEGINIMFDYIAHETKNPEVFAIDVPYLGHLYKNKNFLINSKKVYNRDSKEYAEIEDQIEQLKRFADEQNKITIAQKIPFSWTFERFIKERFVITEACRKMYKQNYEVYACVEYLQNK